MVEHSPPDTDLPARRHDHWALANRYSAAKMLIALLLFIVSAPFADQYRSGQFVSSLLVSAVLISATLAMGNRHWTFVVAKFLLAPALIARWSAHVRPDLVPSEVFSVTSLAFLGFVFVNVFLFILRSPEVNSETLCAGVAGYLLLGLFWAYAYTLLASVSPGAFMFNVKAASPQGVMKSFTAIYFSYITLCSVGYGDIVPVTPAAQMLAIIEAMAGAFYMAVMIARLVAMHSSRRDRV